MRRGRTENDVFARLAADPRLGLSTADLDALVAAPLGFTGAAVSQVQSVVTQVSAVTTKYPEAAAYVPGDIL
jgi:adenylosuccinate lyase